MMHKSAIANSFSRAANTYDQVAKLQREVADRLLARTEYIRMQPKVIVDLGAGTGYCSDKLQQRFKRATILAIDMAEGMLMQHKPLGLLARKKKKRLCADAERLPLASQSVDFVFSNLMLHWCPSLPDCIAEIQRILKPGGVLLFSTLGPDTLKELRQSFASIDQHPHVNEFIDLHDIGDTLLSAHLSQPVMDMDMLTLTYDHAKAVMRDLNQLGASNLHSQRQTTLMGKQRFAKVIETYEQYRLPNGKLPASYEVIYGHAWGQAKPTTAALNSQGEARISVDSLMTSTHHRR